MHRTITFLGIFQIACVVIGFFALGIIPKLLGYSEGLLDRNPPISLFLRRYGLFLLIIPVCWAGYASAAVRIESGLLLHRIAIIVGVLIAIFVILSFLFAITFPLVRLDMIF